MVRNIIQIHNNQLVFSSEFCSIKNVDGTDGSFFTFLVRKTTNLSKCVQNSAHNTHNMK
jgi:hypothetical protein